MKIKTRERAFEIARSEPREVYLTRQNCKMPSNTFKNEKKEIVTKADTTDPIENPNE